MKQPDPFNFMFRYIDDVRSLYNPRFGSFVDHIYPIEFEIKDTTDTTRYASSHGEGQLGTKLYDKRDDFSHCELSIYM